MTPANVIRVDRASQRAEVLMAGTSAPIRAGYSDARRPPPPLGQVHVEQTSSGMFVVRDGISVRESVLDEDFNQVSDAGHGGGVGDIRCDSQWWLSYNSIAVTPYVAHSSQDLPAGAGVLKVTTGNAFADSANLIKDNFDRGYVYDDEKAIWLSGALALDSLANVQVGLNLASTWNNTESVGVGWSSTGGTTFAQAGTAGGSVSTPLPFSPVSRVLFVIDIVLHAGRFAACWINGDGPYYSDSGAGTTVPAPGEDGGVHFGVQTLTAATKSLYADWIHVEQFTQPVHPGRVDFLAIDSA